LEQHRPAAIDAYRFRTHPAPNSQVELCLPFSARRLTCVTGDSA
jgi:hypothetical protein